MVHVADLLREQLHVLVHLKIFVLYLFHLYSRTESISKKNNSCARLCLTCSNSLEYALFTSSSVCFSRPCREDLKKQIQLALECSSVKRLS